MMNDRFDEFLYDALRDQGEEVSDIHYRKLNDVLDNLPKRKPVRLYYKAAIIILSCLILSSSGAYAGISFYYRHFASVCEERIDEIDTLMNSSGADVDSYSRELTVSEKRRLKEQVGRYESGHYPEEEILQVEKISDVKDNDFCYCYENSMIYLPKEELSDEQLLQIAELRALREYVLVADSDEITDDKEGKSATASQAPEEKVNEEITKKRAIEIAREFLVEVLEKDISGSEIEAEKISDREMYSKGMLWKVALYSKDSKNEINVYVELKEGRILSYGEDNHYKKTHNNVKVNSNRIRSCSENILSVYSYITNGGEPLKTEVSYKEDEEGYIIDGILMYYVRNDNNTGYRVEVSMQDDRIIEFNYCDNIDGFIEAENRYDKCIKDNNTSDDYTRIRRTI